MSQSTREEQGQGGGTPPSVTTQPEPSGFEAHHVTLDGDSPAVSSIPHQAPVKPLLLPVDPTQVYLDLGGSL